MIIVSDSSPLITLSKIGSIHLLASLYGTVHVTPEVYAEVAVTGAGLSGASDIAKAEWIRVKASEDDAQITADDKIILGAGDISTVLLAKQLNADAVLMDDRKARALAVKHGITPLGCVGILQDAFGRGLIKDLREAYKALLVSGAYVDRRIVEASLKELKLPELDT